jgi:hypothetical protein
MYPYPVLVIQSPFHHKSVNISNMKLILLLSFFYAGAASAQTGLYDQQVQSLDGSTLNIGDYKTKKIMVASYSIADLQSGGLAYLDSLQQAYPSVVIIAIPAVDFSDSQNVASLDSLKNNLGTHIILTVPAQVNQMADSTQNNLLQWITHSPDVAHFDPQLTTSSQFFVISESGVIYALLAKGVLNETIDQVLNQQDIKQ